MEELILKNQDSLHGINFEKLMLITNKEFVDILKVYLISSDYKLLNSVRINTDTGDVIKIHIGKSIGLYHILIYRTIDQKIYDDAVSKYDIEAFGYEKVKVN